MCVGSSCGGNHSLLGASLRIHSIDNVFSNRAARNHSAHVLQGITQHTRAARNHSAHVLQGNHSAHVLQGNHSVHVLKGITQHIYGKESLSTCSARRCQILQGIARHCQILPNTARYCKARHCQMLQGKALPGTARQGTARYPENKTGSCETVAMFS